MKSLTRKQVVSALIWSFLTLILAFMGTVLVGTISHQDEPMAPLTAEQQQIKQELNTAKRGDIISDPNQSLMKGQAKYFMVRWNDKDDNFGLSPMNNHGTIIPMGQWNIKQMSDVSLRLISSGSQEWIQVMQHFFSADPDSL